MNSKYYSLANIKKKNATYNVIFGERSNGKTFGTLKEALKDYVKTGEQFAYVRRWKEDVSGRRASRLFGGVNESGVVSELTKGEFSLVHYVAGKLYLANIDEKTGKAIYSDSDLIGFLFSLSDSEHDKSTSFPNVTKIIFDEFITPKLYLPDEFVIFMNVVSTIARTRENVKIFMLGNTVNKYCPYFAEMGLKHIEKQKQGTIDVYTYGSSPLKVAVEYCSSVKKSENSSKYFAFDNPKLNMITGGAWEISIYPHLPTKYKPKEVLLTYFIEFSDNVFKCDVVYTNNNFFTFIQRKTTELKNLKTDLIYSLQPSGALNHSSNILKPANKVQEKIYWFFKNDKVFYQDNDVGDTISNYLKNCSKV